MNIIASNLTMNSTLSKRKKTDYIVLHHRAGDGDIASIHSQHLANGWAGVGYHLYVRKNGQVFSGRPLDTVGAHCIGYNEISVGICFEGNFENETMSALQLAAGREAVSYLKALYPSARVVKHGDLIATACPGKNFPFEKLKNGTEIKEAENVNKKKLESANDITWELKQMIEILDSDGFVAALEKAKEEDSPLYWGYYKIVNK